MVDNYNYYAVVGNPISHSLSPYIFNHVFKGAASNSYYTRFLALSEKDVLETSKDLKIRGMNVTAPYKEKLFHSINNLDDFAKEVGALNVITYMAGIPFGYNTDVKGILNTFKEINIDITAREILILGAGGAARAAIKAVHDKALKVVVLNRTSEKAKKLADEYNIEYDSLDNYKDYICNTDVIISTLPDEAVLDFGSMNKFAIFVDANYHKPQAIKHANYVSGEYWLINQAILTYDMFAWYAPEKKEFNKSLHQPRKKFSNIILTGFSGAGKSHLGKKIADELGMDFLDTDVEIEKYRKMSINDIFSKLSEHEFRNTELEILQKMHVCQNTVIATGGGAVEFEASRKQLLANGFVIYCYAPFDICMQRADNTNRPNLRQSEDKIAALYHKRKKLYFTSSDMIVNTNNDEEKLIRDITNDIKRTISLK